MKFLKTSLLALSLFLVLKTNAQTDTSFYNKQYNYKSYIVPAIFMAYGISSFNDNGFPSSLAVRKYRNENYGKFQNSADDYIVFAPGLLMLGLDLFHVKSKSNFANQVALTGKSVILSLTIVNILKYSTQIMRPDGSDNNSFPSGHTDFAFTLAGVLHQEFKDKPLVYIAGYTIATTAGAMRILNNKHWFSDVLVGAAIGMAATKLIYATHQYKWKLNKGGFLPIISSNQAGFVYKF